MFVRRRGWPFRLALALMATAAVVVGLAPASVAAPGDPTTPGNEGGTPSLQKQLEDASKGFLDAQAALQNSRQRQAQLTEQLQSVQRRLGEIAPAAGRIALMAYRNAGSLGNMSALLSSSGSPDALVDRATTLNLIALRSDRQLHELATLRADLQSHKAAIDSEVANQERQLGAMAKKKQDAERALASNGGGQPTAGPSSGGSATATATAAPRGSNGQWPAESCSIKDPTTSGCVTPRLLHALQQAKAAGFTRYVSCWRSGGSGEHPKGRACDFAAATGGFGGVATGGDKAYGDRLAAYFLANASRLAVLYVIWYRQIWLPSSGWRAYHGGGDPSSDHTNHDHLSVY
jgi:peptidoglycan DL-endopeptidase CwlO